VTGVTERAANLGELLRHASWLRRLARQLADQPADVEDLLQDTWTAAWPRPPDPGRPPRPWLAEVLRNFARMGQRSSTRRTDREHAADELAVRNAPATDDLIAQVELQRRLAELVLELEEPYRSTILLRYHEDRTATDIARQEGIAPATVRWRLKEGLSRLRQRMDERYGDQRRAWVGLLPATEPSVATGLGKGLVLMKLKTKAGLLVAMLLLLAVGAGVIWKRGAAPERSSAADSTQATPAHPMPPQTGSRPWQAGATGPAVLGAIDGVVVDSRDQPVPGATVALARRVDPANSGAAPLAGTSVTGADGRFRIADVAPGTFTATATASPPGLHPAVQTGIQVTGGTRSLRLVMTSGGVLVEGRVLDHEGGILPGARVTARATPSAGQAPGDGPLMFLTATDRQGAWSMTLPSGQYALKGELDGYAPGTLSLTLVARARADLVLEPASGIFGRVVHASTGAPVPGARVQVIPTYRRGTWAPAVESDADGRFRLQRLPLGEFLIQARLGRLIGKSGPVAVVPARAIMDVEVLVSEAFVIAGRVVTADARPAGGVAVMSESVTDGGVSWGEAGPTGEFEIAGVLPGKHQIQVWLKDGGRARREVTVENDDVTGVELRITPGLVVRGHVDDRHGRPAPGVRVVATTDAGGGAERYNRIATTDASGDFQLPPDIPWGVLSLRAGRPDDGLALWGPQPTKPGAVVNVSLRLGEGAGLTGIVRNDDGSPAAGARILVVNPEGGNGDRAQVVAGADGRYRLAALAPGWARAAAGRGEPPRLEEGFTRVQLTEGQEATLDLRLPRSASLRGQVHLPDGRPGAGALVLASTSSTKPWPEQARRTLADDDGRFQLDGLAHGRSYNLWVDLPGYPTERRGSATAGGADIVVSFSVK
jgi:RNA polymerase sigma factor (sigma-70 family)